MNSESKDFDPYEVVLADLRARRAQIDQTIQYLESIRGGGAPFPATIPVGQVSQFAAEPSPEGPGYFLGMTIVDATKKLLGLRKTPLTNKQIAHALIAGGVVLTSSDPINTVGSILNRRAKEVGDIFRVGKTWRLAEWSPGRGRVVIKKPLPKGEGDEANGTSEP